MLRDAARLGLLPPGRPHAPPVRFREDLPDGAGHRSRGPDRRGARDDSRQRVQGLLYPPDRLPRLSGARRQPVPLPGRQRDPDVGMGRLPGRRGDPARRRRPHQLLVAGGAEHVSDAGEELGELRQLAADQDGSDRRGLQRGDRARHPGEPERRQRPEPVPGARRRAVHAVDARRRSFRASPATR